MPKVTEKEAISVETELEYVWFVNLNNIDWLTDNVKEYRSEEQYQLLFDTFSARVRQTNGEKCTYTTKTWKEGVTGRLESTHDITEADFDKYAELVGEGWFKVRYFMESPYLRDGEPAVFEIDVFYQLLDDEVTISRWCKIDLEVDSVIEEKIELPIPKEYIDKVLMRTAKKDPVLEENLTTIKNSWNQSTFNIKTIKAKLFE